MVGATTYEAPDGFEYEFRPQRAAKIALVLSSLTSFIALVFLIRVRLSLDILSGGTDHPSAPLIGRLDCVGVRRTRLMKARSSYFRSRHWDGRCLR
jgi:hypothetical protein